MPSLFVDPNAESSHHPQINRASRTLVMPSLAARQEEVVASRAHRLSAIAESVEAERKQTETFAPRINASNARARYLASSPRSGSTEGREAQEPEFSSAATGGPQPLINPHSRALARDAREQLDRVAAIRRSLRDAWQRHAEANTMSTGALFKALREVGLPSDPLAHAKFCSALAGTTPLPPHYTVPYDRYMEVLGAVLQRSSAATRSSSSSAETGASSRQQHAAEAQQPHCGRTKAQPPPPQQKTAGASTAAAASSSLANRPSSISHHSPAAATPRQALADSTNRQRPPQADKNRGASAPRSGPPPSSQPARRLPPPRSPSTSTTSTATSGEYEVHPVRAGGSAAPVNAANRKHHTDVSPYVPKAVLEARQCTFKPKTTTLPHPRQTDDVRPPPDAKGVQEVIERMARAREEKKRSFNEMLRDGEQSTQAEAKPSGRFVATKPKPFHLRLAARPHDRTRPYLYVDVDMPGHREGRIAVHHGDTAEALASSFAARHGLPASASSTLRDLLRERMREYQYQQQQQQRDPGTTETGEPLCDAAAVVCEQPPRQLHCSPQQRGTVHSTMTPGREARPTVRRPLVVDPSQIVTLSPPKPKPCNKRRQPADVSPSRIENNSIVISSPSPSPEDHRTSCPAATHEDDEVFTVRRWSFKTTPPPASLSPPLGASAVHHRHAPGTGAPSHEIDSFVREEALLRDEEHHEEQHEEEVEEGPVPSQSHTVDMDFGSPSIAGRSAGRPMPPSVVGADGSSSLSPRQSSSSSRTLWL